MSADYPEPIIQPDRDGLVWAIGADGSLPPVRLRSGLMTMSLAGLELHNICADGVPIVSLIRPLVSLPSGRVEPCELRCVHCTASTAGFVVALHAVYRLGGVALAATCTAQSVDADTVRYAFRALALTRFWRDQIGLEIGASREVAARVCELVGVFENHAEGALHAAGTLPGLADGITAVTLPVRPDLQARLALEGEALEIHEEGAAEWVKMRATPSAATLPLEIQPGTEIRQSLIVRLISKES